MKYSVLLRLGIAALFFSFPAGAADRPEFNYNVDQIVGDAISSANQQVGAAMQQVQGSAESAERQASEVSGALGGLSASIDQSVSNIQVPAVGMPAEAEKKISAKAHFKKQPLTQAEKRKRRWEWFKRRRAAEAQV